MNTKETQQVMNNDEYISLYDYRGAGSRESGLGQKVFNAAKEKSVHVIYKDIPEERQRPEYTRVATYPKWFLNEYFGVAPDALEIRIVSLEAKVEMLGNIIAKLTETPNNHVTSSNEWDDELPF